MKDSQIEQLTKRVGEVTKMYRKEYPDVLMDRDYVPFKLTEEWGECMQAYLMLTDRGRQKGLSKEEIHCNLAKEMADVFGYLLVFAKQEDIDLPRALEEKWFVYLKERQDEEGN